MNKNRLISMLVSLPITLAGLGIVYQALGKVNDERKYSAPGKLVDVGSYRLHLYCKGEGNVTVVMDPGLAEGSLVWSRVQSEVAKFARVCAYDRAGYAWSDSSPIPRTSDQIAKELSMLLHNADIKGPYTLVGHPFSGLTMRLFASQHPDAVVGMVLVDAVSDKVFTEDYDVYHKFFDSLGRTFRMLSLITGVGLLRLAVQLRLANAVLPSFITSQPVQVQPLLLAGYLENKNFVAAIAEATQVEQSAKQLRQAMPIEKDMPLVVLTHGIPSMFSGLSRQDAQEAERIWQDQQTGISRLSSQGTLIVAEQSGHDIHVDQPELVVEAIKMVYETAMGAE